MRDFLRFMAYLFLIALMAVVWAFVVMVAIAVILF